MAKTTNPDETAEVAPCAGTGQEVDPGKAAGDVARAQRRRRGVRRGLPLHSVRLQCGCAWSGAVKPPAEHKKGEAEPAGEGEGDGTVEIDLREYSVTVFQAASNSTMRIDFHLYGIVAKEKEPRFKQLLEKNQARLREQVVQTIRGAQLADLNDDPSLGLIKRTILAKVNTILGEPLLKDLIISDFASLEN